MKILSLVGLLNTGMMRVLLRDLAATIGYSLGITCALLHIYHCSFRDILLRKGEGGFL